MPVSSRGRVSVVGESYRREGIAFVVDGRHVPEAGHWDEAISVDAALVPEPANRFDANAVRVDLATPHGWVTAGYISAANAVHYQPMLRSMTERGQLPCAPARICMSSGGTLAVYLHLSAPEKCVMKNEAPAAAVTLAGERACAVTGEAKHQEAIEAFRPSPGGSTAVWATLHRSTVAAGKYAGEPTLEVQIDGQRIGVMTAAQGQRYERVLAHASNVACEAEVSLGKKNLEVQVFLPRVD